MTDKRKAAPGQEAANQDALNKHANYTTAPVGRQVKVTERELLALQALLSGPQTVRDIRACTDANNAGEVIAGLRRKGYVVSTEWLKFVTKEGRPSRYGVYHLLPESRARAIKAVSEAAK